MKRMLFGGFMKMFKKLMILAVAAGLMKSACTEQAAPVQEKQPETTTVEVQQEPVKKPETTPVQEASKPEVTEEEVDDQEAQQELDELLAQLQDELGKEAAAEAK